MCHSPQSPGGANHQQVRLAWYQASLPPQVPESGWGLRSRGWGPWRDVTAPKWGQVAAREYEGGGFSPGVISYKKDTTCTPLDIFLPPFVRTTFSFFENKVGNIQRPRKGPSLRKIQQRTACQRLVATRSTRRRKETFTARASTLATTWQPPSGTSVRASGASSSSQGLMLCKARRKGRMVPRGGGVEIGQGQRKRGTCSGGLAGGPDSEGAVGGDASTAAVCGARGGGKV